MDYLITPVIVGIVSFFIYMIFELLVRRKERLKMIEKIGLDIIPVDQSVFQFEFNSLLPFKKKYFSSLRIGCLMVGLGLGLIVGLFIFLYLREHESLIANNRSYNEFFDLVYGSSLLLFGGLGLLVSYFIENKLPK